MKKMKVSLAAIAVVIAVGLSAFTVPEAKLTDAWFSIVTTTAPNLAASYNYFGTTSPCASTDHFCAIKGIRQASPNQNLPLQSSVDAASTASNNFTHVVANQVTFAAP